MAKQPQVAIVGAKKLRKELKAAQVDMKVLTQPHREAALLVARVAKPRSPNLSGDLKKSVRGSGTRTAAIVRAGGKQVPYANVIHWGWPQHNIEPQPWVSQAAQMSEPQWLPEYVAHMNRVLATIDGASAT